MKNHWEYLLPFSPDTSGFCCVVSGTDGCGIIDDPQGCVTNYLIYEEDRKLPQRVFHSQLCNMDVIFGSEEKLVNRYEAAASLSPSFALLGGSPVSALIGTDITAAARMLKRRYRVPCAAVELTGDRFYHEGIRNTCLALAELLFGKNPVVPDRIPGSVNLLGTAPLDIGIFGAAAAKEAALKEYSSVLSVWGGTGEGSAWQDLQKAGAAEWNLVLCADAVPLAEKLKAFFGTPWKRYFPFQPEASPLLKEDLNADLRCLIIGEPFLSRGIQTVLSKAFPGEVKTASFFSGTDEDTDVPLKDESDLRVLLDCAAWDLAVADSAFQSFPGMPEHFVPLVHRAVSGLLYTGQAPEYPDECFWDSLLNKLRMTAKACK